MLGYFRNQSHRMDYPSYEANGWFIAKKVHVNSYQRQGGTYANSCNRSYPLK